MSVYDTLNERLQPIYAELQIERGITTGDIDPLTYLELEEAEHHLAAVIERWLRLAA